MPDSGAVVVTGGHTNGHGHSRVELYTEVSTYLHIYIPTYLRIYMSTYLHIYAETHRGQTPRPLPTVETGGSDPLISEYHLYLLSDENTLHCTAPVLYPFICRLI